MTQDDWRTSADLDDMLTHARRRCRFPARKRRLFAVACCRRVEGLLPEPHCRALDVAERFADGLASRTELTAAWSAAYYHPRTLSSHAAWAACTAACPGEARLMQGYLSTVSLYVASTVARRPVRAASPDPAAWHGERARHRHILRDLVPPPRQLDLDFASLPPVALAVARAVYEERRFEEIAVLADALEEAGCDAAEVLAHFREPGEHVRGCWAVDLLLGRP
jgi:hypothetical protein